MKTLWIHPRDAIVAPHLWVGLHSSSAQVKLEKKKEEIHSPTHITHFVIRRRHRYLLQSSARFIVIDGYLSWMIALERRWTRIPAVFLTASERLAYEPITTWRDLWAKRPHSCVHCGIPLFASLPPQLSMKEYLQYAQPTLEHLLPLSQGGTDARCNLALSCLRCNQAHADQTPWIAPEAFRWDATQRQQRWLTEGWLIAHQAQANEVPTAFLITA